MLATTVNTSLNPGYDAKAAEFSKMFPISDSSLAAVGQISADQKGQFTTRNLPLLVRFGSILTDCL